MKISTFLTTTLSIFLTITTSAQVVSAGLTKENGVYIGIDNPMTIAVENYDCDDLIVTSVEGKITKNSDCYYNMRAAEPGEISIIVSTLNKGKTDTLGKLVFRAIRIPDPVAQVARKSGGTISAGEFRVQRGVAAVLLNFGINAKYRTIEYSCSIKKPRKNSFKYIDTSNEPSFTDKMKSAFQKVSSGDLITFYSIKVKSPDGTIRNLSPITFKITEKPKAKKSKFKG